MEIWENVEDFEGIYQISNHGRLKSFKAAADGRVLSNKIRKGDYLAVVLQANGKTKHTRMHRLVAECFIPNIFGGNEVNHRDGNKQNNHAPSLSNAGTCFPKSCSAETHRKNMCSPTAEY